jgi:hypothetical protein
MATYDEKRNGSDELARVESNRIESLDRHPSSRFLCEVNYRYYERSVGMFRLALTVRYYSDRGRV